MSFLSYIIRRLLLTIPLLLGISVITFIVIQLPPGDFLTTYVTQLRTRGYEVTEAEVARLERQYGLDRPPAVQYFIWVRNIILKGDLGRSFSYDRPVAELIGERIILSMVVSICTILFTWIVGLFIGVFSATHQYSFLDYVVTFVGFIGISLPGFLMALLMIYVGLRYFNVNLTGLFSHQYLTAPWSIAKVLNMFQRLWVVVVVLGIGGTAAIIRVLRGSLLDELRKPYVTTGRCKGLSERQLLWRYPVRIAVNPFLSTIGWLLPAVFSGEALASIVLNIPTTGPLLLHALQNQDMYLAGSFVLILSALTVVGTLVSDLLLAYFDPRIRFQIGRRTVQ
jgi:peptide/nickel transport system permease protein